MDYREGVVILVVVGVLVGVMFLSMVKTIRRELWNGSNADTFAIGAAVVAVFFSGLVEAGISVGVAYRTEMGWMAPIISAVGMAIGAGSASVVNKGMEKIGQAVCRFMDAGN